MDGPAHYREAEGLLQYASSDEVRNLGLEDRVIAEAQVHATLASAAAVFDSTRGAHSRAWARWDHALAHREAPMAVPHDS